MKAYVDAFITFLWFTAILCIFTYMLMMIDPPKRWVDGTQGHYEYVVPKD